MGDLWEEVWGSQEQCIRNGWKFIIHKVKAHTGMDDIESGRITAVQQRGNSLADHWAGVAAGENAAGAATISMVSWAMGPTQSDFSRSRCLEE